MTPAEILAHLVVGLVFVGAGFALYLALGLMVLTVAFDDRAWLRRSVAIAMGVVLAAALYALISWAFGVVTT